jgi:hypothetical protein
MKIRIATAAVCKGHHAPWRFFSDLHLKRPGLALVLGPRGGGKSFLAALDVHITSLFQPEHETRVLGGSLAQSEQVYRALKELLQREEQDGPVPVVTRSTTKYPNGSEVKTLAASATSVRGPHIPTLRLDEVDEIDSELRDAALGMCMNKHGYTASAIMTSTWHRVGGPMGELLERARAGEFPSYMFCAFEILEPCSETRSGPQLEHCPDCPLMKWCHEDRDLHPLGLPKAKRSRGHYSIDALIQKVRATSARTFEADYLCRGPRTDGIWFTGFDPATHVSIDAEHDPRERVLVAVDPGVFTGAVFFHMIRGQPPKSGEERIVVFADYLNEGGSAEGNARAILEIARTQCQGRIDMIWADPAGGARTAIGPSVIAEFERAGLRPLQRWPSGSVADGLALVESFIQPAEGAAKLQIHPRCTATIAALRAYRRARRGGQWQDWPDDPQHPYEDLVDALRGGLRACFPEGRVVATSFRRIGAGRVF